MALSDFDKYKKLDVVSVSGTPTISHAVPIKITSGDDSSTGTGEIVLDWTNISSESDIAVYDENDNLLDYWIESFDSTNESAVVHVYRDWVQDGSTQCKVAYGSGPSDQSTTKETVFDKEKTNSNLVSGWALNESSGDALDLTSNNNDGTVNGVTQGATGQVDGSYDFDGADDEVNVGDQEDLEIGTRDMTYTFWFNVDNFDSSTWHIIGDGGVGSSNTEGIRISVSNGDLDFWLQDTGTSHVAAGGSTSLSSDTWYHGAITIDRDGNAIIYLNGNQDGSIDASSTDGEDIQNSEPFLIGNSMRDDWFDGTIDDVRVYDRALSSDEISAKYDASKGTPDFFSQQAAETTVLTLDLSDSLKLSNIKIDTAEHGNTDNWTQGGNANLTVQESTVKNGNKAFELT